MDGERYWHLVSDRISRRQALRAAGLLGGSAVTLGVLGCSDDDDEGSDAPSSTGGGSTGGTGASPTTAPSTGATSSGGEPVVDRLVISQEYTGSESNNTKNHTGTEGWQLEPLYESLLSYDRETGAIIPSLAMEYEPGSDGLSIRFKLREGVQFHDDWGEMTADDVVFTFDEFLVSGENAVPGVSAYIDHVEKVNDYEVIFHLKVPDAGAFTFYITDLYVTGGILSKAHWESAGEPTSITDPPLAGTGPWKLVEREAGSFILFERVEEHWRKVPDFKQLEFRVQNEVSTRLASLLAEEVHITPLPTDLYPSATSAGMEVIECKVPSLRVHMEYYGCCGINVKTGELDYPESPLLDLRVRKALNKAVDRQALNDAFLDGKGELMVNAHHHPTRPGWDPSWVERFEDEYGYDPDAARALLAEAGYGPDNPLQTNVLLNFRSAVPAGADMQETIIGYWQDIGVEAEFLTLDRATIEGRRESPPPDGWGNHFAMSGTSSDFLGGLRVYQMNDLQVARVDPDYTGNYRGVYIEGLDDLFDELRYELNEERFDELAREIGELLFVNHAFLPMFWLPGEVLANSKVVSDWVWPGHYAGFFSHTEYVEAVKKS